MASEDYVEGPRAVFDATADEYVGFAGTTLGPATESAVDRSLLGAFAELVALIPGSAVADVGCGPGRVAAFLTERQIEVVGVDVSTAMLAAARRAHPDVNFKQGRLDDLPFTDGSLAGAACWYSIIYTPPELLDSAFGELARVLQPGGYLLVAFQAGAGEGVKRTGVHGTPLSLVSYRHSVSGVCGRIEAAGFAVHTTAQRARELDHESTPQAFVIARRLPLSARSAGRYADLSSEPGEHSG